MNRIEPNLPASHMKTYGIIAPKSTHHRPATCEEVECGGFLYGWRTLIDERTVKGQEQAHFIRRMSGRGFTETKTPTGGTVFTFPAGQRCFSADSHTVPIGKPELFIVRDGDWRGNPRGTATRTHASPDDWVDDFANHQQVLADRLNQG